MRNANDTPGGLTCHRCGKAMDFHSEEVVEDKRVAVFRCSECDTLEAIETSKAAQGNEAA